MRGAPTTSQCGACACAVDASTSAGDPVMCSPAISAEIVYVPAGFWVCRICLWSLNAKAATYAMQTLLWILPVSAVTKLSASRVYIAWDGGQMCISGDTISKIYRTGVSAASNNHLWSARSRRRRARRRGWSRA